MTTLRVVMIGFGGLAITMLLLLWMTLAIEQEKPPPELIEHRVGSTTEVSIALNDDAAETKSACEDLVRDTLRFAREHGACSFASDCMHVRSGYLDMVAVNKAVTDEIEYKLERIVLACGSRKSHDVFYSDYGIEIGCDAGQCVVSEVTADRKAEILTAEALDLVD